MSPTADELDTIYLTLCHQHLPKLDDADVVMYDRNAETVRPGVNFDSLMCILEQTSAQDLPWTDGTRTEITY